jgi:hypothetical protein
LPTNWGINWGWWAFQAPSCGRFALDARQNALGGLTDGAVSLYPTTARAKTEGCPRGRETIFPKTKAHRLLRRSFRFRPCCAETMRLCGTVHDCHQQAKGQPL